MAFTLRPNTEQSGWLDRLIETTGQRTASKAIWVSVRDYPTMMDTIARLESEAASDDVKALRKDIARLTVVVRERPANAVQDDDAQAECSVTFGEMAAEYMGTRADLSERARRAWSTTLGYVEFGSVPVDAVTVEDVRDSLLPRWTGKGSVGDKLLSRVRAVFAYAIAKGLRTGNPAVDAKAILPKVKASNGHHHSLPHASVGRVLRAVLASDAYATVKLALRLIVLTGCRSGEARGATLGEFDMEARTWTVPGERMKTGKAHTVPLSDQAMAVVAEAKAILPYGGSDTTRLFPTETGLLMSDRALSNRMRLAGETTVHGLRSSFKSWCIEQGYRREAVEACLAHAIGLTEVEEAYVATSLVEERRAILDQWAAYVLTD